jgi:predicted peroxiredoxin
VDKTVWIFCGSNEPQKAFPPFMLASGALALEMKTNLFFTMGGLHIVERGGAEKIHLEGAPRSLPEFLDLVREAGGRLVACTAALPMEGMGEEDIIDGVEFGGVATFVSGAEEADLVLTF